MPYTFKYFEPIHIKALTFFILVSFILFIIPYFIKEKNKEKYVKFLGFLLLFSKIFDILFRIIVEKEPWFSTMPFHLCNMAIIFGSLYYITRKNIFFNIIYFWFSGAILAVILPGITTYHSKIYIYVFMSTHVLEIFAVVFAFVHLKVKITFKGLITSIIGYLMLILLALTWNYFFKTNFMYINDYIIAPINFIKPFIVYQVLLVLLFLASIVVMYLPFSKEND